MKKKFYFLITLIIFTFSIFIYNEIYKSYGKETWYKKILPEETKKAKHFLKNSIFKKIDEDYNYNRIIVSLSNENENLKKNIIIKNKRIEKFINDKGKINFYLTSQKNIHSLNFKKKYKISIYTSDDLLRRKHLSHPVTSTAYLDIYENNLFLASGEGIFSYINFNDIGKNNKFELNIIQTNLKELITQKEFFEDSYFGIKDVKIYNNQIYISYSNEIKKDCFNTSILYANLNFQKLDFKDFFASKSCVDLENDFGLKGIWAQGGRMVFDKNHMFFTIGTWGYETLAQHTKSIYGKIISINLLDKTYQIISTGHRNPQGIFYDKETNTILSTEHGPDGGDEFNINHLSENPDKIKNYGWPISSYGMPLNDRNNDKLNNEMLKKAPHYKSHEKYGFIEPLVHWSPGIGISDITEVSGDFARSKSKLTKHYVIGAMGREEMSNIGALSLNYFELDLKNNKIISKDIIAIKERIRDLAFIDSSNKLVLFLETSGSIAILE